MKKPAATEGGRADPGFEAAYEGEVRALLLERTRVAVLVGMILYSAFWALDLAVAGEHGRAFLSIRLAVVALSALTLALTYTRAGRRLILPLSAGIVLLASFGISAMTVLLGGFGSDYYFGHLLALFFVGFFMPWSPFVTTVFCAVLALGYFVPNLAFHGAGIEMLAPSFFLLGTCVFTMVASVVGDRLRRRDLTLRRRLERAYDELKRLDEAKTRFFANVSHELRTPLTLMFGPVESLLRGEAEAGKTRLLQAVFSNAQRLLRQVNLLLDTAKLESGRLKLEAAPGDLGALVGELVTASAPHAERKGITLTTRGLSDLPEINFDRDKIEVVVANLLSNALKFTPSGGRIEVRTEALEDRVAFEVEDTGPGIPLDQRELIFERFHQVEVSLARGEPGTGLGLALVRELVRLHQGEILLRSEVARGSIFRVEIPRSLVGVPPDRRRAPRRREDRLAQARTEALTAREFEWRSRREVLLADLHLPAEEAAAAAAAAKAPAGAPAVRVVVDNADLRAYLASELGSRYRVLQAGDGQQALEVARASHPDLIISDVMMPRMDGHEFCRLLRQDQALAATPVIMVTAKAGSEALVEGLEIGADDYVTKPFSIDELQARIAAHLRAKDLERQLNERETRLAAIGKMTGTVVHDLKNALMVIQGYSDLVVAEVAEGVEGADLLRDLGQIRSGTERLRRMVEEILDFARGGSIPLRLSPVDAEGYLDGVLEPLASSLRKASIELRATLDPVRGVEVVLDADRIQRVFENLILNSREAIQGADGAERFVAVRAMRDGDGLAVRVADSGPGIAKEIAEHIFEPFASSGKRQGTGLGLVTVRNLVKAHGGDIRIEPKSPEGGAAFTIILPLAGPEEAA